MNWDEDVVRDSDRELLPLDLRLVLGNDAEEDVVVVLDDSLLSLALNKLQVFSDSLKDFIVLLLIEIESDDDVVLLRLKNDRWIINILDFIFKNEMSRYFVLFLRFYILFYVDVELGSLSKFLNSVDEFSGEPLSL